MLLKKINLILKDSGAFEKKTLHLINKYMSKIRIFIIIL